MTIHAYPWARSRAALLLLVMLSLSAAPASQVAAMVPRGTNSPSWHLQAQLTHPSSEMGNSVAISGDTAVIGDQAVNTVYVYSRSGTTWTQQAMITATDPGPHDEFGASVAFNGTTLVVGAPLHNRQTGAVYVFTTAGGTWTQQAELTPLHPIYRGLFGSSVATSGNTLLAGATSPAQGFGAAYVFVRSGPTWSEEAKLSPSDGTFGDFFGGAVSIISGTTALIGAPGENSNIGAAYVFTGSGTTWTQQAELTSNDGNFGLGTSVALNGNTAVVGEPGAAGGAFVYVGSGSTWTQQAALPVPSGAMEYGLSVALNGNTVVVGAPQTLYNGTAYVFVRSGSTWLQQATLQAPSSATHGRFGQAVALNANTALIGSPQNDTAYVFVRS